MCQSIKKFPQMAILHTTGNKIVFPGAIICNRIAQQLKNRGQGACCTVTLQRAKA